ncbi:ATP-dependent DNA helicase [Trichonephila clavipes]|nr:ATP-dependent DNA helicase [Trichonephila clavipes]
MLQYPPEYRSSLTPSGVTLAKLNFKLDCDVMLLINLCITDVLCNGTRLEKKNIQKNIPQYEILSGDKKGEMVCIPRITLDTRGGLDLPFVLKRTKFPVRLAFVMTINKSQV